MKWDGGRGRIASGDSCFGARPKVPMESHEGDGETDEVRFFGIVGVDELQKEGRTEGDVTEQLPKECRGDRSRRGLV